MKEYIVDLSGVRDRESLHARLKESLPLPTWYGSNLDALYDALTEIDETCIYFRGWDRLEADMQDYFDRFRKVIADVQMDAPGLFCFFEKEGEEEEAGEEERPAQEDPLDEEEMPVGELPGGEGIPVR